MVIFHSYVSLPAGILRSSANQFLGRNPRTGLFFAFSSQEEKKLFQAADDKISAMHLGRPWGTAVVFLAYHLVI